MATADRFGDQTARGVEALYATPDVAAQRARILETLRPAEGERIADLGCGPGYLTRELAAAVGPAGVVHGLDLGVQMVALAERRCAAHANCRIEIGDARALPFPAGAFDALASIQVLEHVDQVEVALAEMARVLRPAGRVVIMATDWDGLVIESQDRARLARVLHCWEGHRAQPHLPGRLGALLRQAGLEVREVSALPMLYASWDAEIYAVRILGMIHAFASRRGDPGDAAGFFEEQQRLGAEGRFFFCLNRFLFLAGKAANPGPA